MGIEHAQRRASYGPTSPRIGLRGSRTRDRIMAETLALFASRGLQGTTVYDIADAADVSRAALYQYFASKDEIVNELVAECDRALVDMMDGVGPVGPTAAGLDQLRSWIVAWSAIHDRYGVLFVRWAGVDLPDAAGFHVDYQQRLAGHLRVGGLSAMSPAAAAALLTGVVHRFSFLRFAAPSSRAQEPGAVDEVANVLQRVLFPSTPRNVLRTALMQRRTPPVQAGVGRRGGPSRLDELTAGLSACSAQTVRLIVSAGAESFAERGYYGANVDAIVRQAGFARGTFYRYFADKLDLLLVLADEFEDAAFVHLMKLEQLPMDGPGSAARRAWAAELLRLRDAHVGVMRSLLDGSPHDRALEESNDRLHDLISTVLGTIVRSAGVADIVTPWGGQVVVIGALDRCPTAELVTTVVERGLLGGSGETP